MTVTDRVNECALLEVKQNDTDDQVCDTVRKGWSKDQWISGVMERALGVVDRSAEKDRQEFKLSSWTPDGVRFSVQDDKHLSTCYEEQGEFWIKHLVTYFPIRNIHLSGDGRGEPIHIQGTQRSDSINLLNLADTNGERKVCICFEGDGHNLDQGKSKDGIYMHEKMFQSAGLCHDINPNVSVIFDKDRFQTCSVWSEKFLQAHVALVEQSLQYVNNHKTSSIHHRLQVIHPDGTDSREFDFFCWVNAKRVDARQSVESDASLSFDLMNSDGKRDERNTGDDFESVLEWCKMLTGREKTLEEKCADAKEQDTDGLL